MTQKSSSNLIIKTLLLSVLIIIPITNFVLTIFYIGIQAMFHLNLLIPLALNIAILIVLYLNFKRYRLIAAIMYGIIAVLSFASLISYISLTLKHSMPITSNMILHMIASIFSIIFLISIVIYFIFDQPKHKIWLIIISIISFLQMIVQVSQFGNYLINYAYSLSIYDAINVFRFILIILHIPLTVIFLYIVTKEALIDDSNS